MPVSFQGWELLERQTLHTKQMYQIHIDRQFFKHNQKCTHITTHILGETKCKMNENSSILSSFKNRAHNNLQSPTEPHNCTVMLLHSLANAHWVSVDCTLQLTPNVICMRDPFLFRGHHKTTLTELKACSQHDLSAGENNCFYFQLNTKYQSAKQSPRNLSSTFALLNSLFKAVHFKQMVFLYSHKDVFPNYVETIYKKVWIGEHNESKHLLNNESFHGWVPFQSNVQNIHLTKRSLFLCNNSQVILTAYLCDNENDCDEGSPVTSDELVCTCNRTYQMYDSCNNTKKCSPLFHMNKHGTCTSYLESPSGTVGHFSSETGLPCERKNQLSCSGERDKCFSFHDICIFRIDPTRGHLVPCKFGSHLQNCHEYRCNYHFKCEGFYCVPWKYLCDGKWDCSDGRDENTEDSAPCTYQNTTCKHKFRCKNSHICIHTHEICDGQHDCPKVDDELLCNIFVEGCIIGCNCLNLAIACENVSLTSEVALSSQVFIAYHLTWCSLTSIFFLWSENTETLNVTHNDLAQICWHELRTVVLKSLDVSHNIITNLSRSCFSNLPQFSFIDLSYNSVRLIEQRTFINISTGLSINLESNDLDYLQHKIFHNVCKLAVLNLRNNPLTQLDIDIFWEITIKEILASQFEICCLKPESECNAAKPWYLSCSRLLHHHAQRVVYICVSVLIILLNCIPVYFSLRKSKGPYESIMVLIHLAHSLPAVCLIILWSSDLHHGDAFVLRQESWKNSSTCSVVFWLFTMNGLLLPLAMSFLFLSILMVTIHPLDSKFKSTYHVNKWILFIFASVVLISVSSTLMLRLLSGVPSAICLPFEDPTGLHWQTKLITIFIFAVQISEVIFVTICHFKTVAQIKRSGKEAGRKAEMSKQNRAKFICVTSSNTLSWFCSSIIFVTCLFAETYPTDMIIWAAGLMIPFSALTHPVVNFAFLQAKKCQFGSETHRST